MTRALTRVSRQMIQQGRQQSKLKSKSKAFPGKNLLRTVSGAQPRALHCSPLICKHSYLTRICCIYVFVIILEVLWSKESGTFLLLARPLSGKTQVALLNLHFERHECLLYFMISRIGIEFVHKNIGARNTLLMCSFPCASRLSNIS